MRPYIHQGHAWRCIEPDPFPLFNANDFADGPFASGILTDKECFSLLVWFLTRKGPLLFSTKARSGTDAVADVNWDREAQNFDLCTNRFNEGEHPHPTKEICVLLGVDAPQSADTSNSRAESVKRCMDLLEHACECSDANCSRATCRKMKNVVQHAKLCKKRLQHACPQCKQLIALCCCHAKQCDVDACPVVFCSSLRQKHQEQKQEKTRIRDLLRDKCETARASCGHKGVHWICFVCYEVCCGIADCECSRTVHSDRTTHALYFNATSVFCSLCDLLVASK
ncbi:CBP-1 protein [Aphelenchoides avenae]|nr:CBP-1 protein [Aphelenchus avenae]